MQIRCNHYRYRLRRLSAVTKLLEKKPNATIHKLERGLWWFTSERPLPDFIKDDYHSATPQQQGAIEDR